MPKSILHARSALPEPQFQPCIRSIRNGDTSGTFWGRGSTKRDEISVAAGKSWILVEYSKTRASTTSSRRLCGPKSCLRSNSARSFLEQLSGPNIFTYLPRVSTHDGACQLLTHVSPLNIWTKDVVQFRTRSRLSHPFSHSMGIVGGSLS